MCSILLCILNLRGFVLASEKFGHRKLLSSSYEHWLEDKADGYDHHQHLASTTKTDGVDIYWKIVDDSLHIAVAANATGWVGFGIAEAGGMPGSDIVIFSAADNSVVDTHALANAKPIVDDCQDWELIDSVIDTSDNIIIFEAKRAIDTGDAQDRALKNDSMVGTPSHRVIVAWGDTTEFMYHRQNRGFGLVRFFQSKENSASNSSTSLMDQSTSSLDLRVGNFTIPDRVTTYVNFCFNSSNLPSDLDPSVDAHIVGIDFLEHSETFKYVHHILFYGKRHLCIHL